MSAAQPNIAQKPIMSMEDDEDYDSDHMQDRNANFRSFKSLMEPDKVACLAVFVNFILSNSAEAPVLFFLISELYKDGNAKEMRKWAYEIHSTFLVPTAVSVMSRNIFLVFSLFSCIYSLCTSKTWTSRWPAKLTTSYRTNTTS